MEKSSQKHLKDDKLSRKESDESSSMGKEKSKELTMKMKAIQKKMTKDKTCEERLVPKQHKKKTKAGSAAQCDRKKDKESKTKASKMDIYIETVVRDCNTSDHIEGSTLEVGGSHGSNVILQAIDCAVSDMQSFENTIIEHAAYELTNSNEAPRPIHGLPQSHTKDINKHTKHKRKDKLLNDQKKNVTIIEEEILLPIDTGMVVEVCENEEGVEGTSIPVNTPEKAPGYGYMSYAHNFGVDAEMDDKDCETVANLTGDEEQDKDKTKDDTATLQPQYTVRSGYSPKSQQTPKFQGAKNTESTSKKTKKTVDAENETGSALVALSKSKTAVAKAKGKAQTVISTKAQRKTSTTLKASSKSCTKLSSKNGQLGVKSLKDVICKDKLDNESKKDTKKKTSKTNKNKIDRINRVMAALNTVTAAGKDNDNAGLHGHLETTPPIPKEKTKKKKKSRTDKKDKERKEKDKKKRKHKSSKEKHEFGGSKKKKKKSKKAKNSNDNFEEEQMPELLESHHHHKPRKRSKKDKGKHRKKTHEGETSTVDTNNDLKIKRLSETITRLETSIQSEQQDVNCKHDTTEKNPTTKRPLEKLYDVDVAARKTKTKVVKNKNITKAKKLNGKSRGHTADSTFTNEVSKLTSNNSQSILNSKGDLEDDNNLNLATPLHIDIPEDQTQVRYTKGVGRGRGRRKYGGASRILAVKKTVYDVMDSKKDEMVPDKNSLTTSQPPSTAEESNIESHPFCEGLVEKEKPTEESDIANKDNKNKEQTPSPQSATTCMSEEALFSDSGIGTDNNSNADHHVTDVDHHVTDADHQSTDKRSKLPNNDVEIAPGVMASHPLATSAHGLYGYGKKDKSSKQMNWPVMLGRRKRKKHWLTRPTARITPEFIFELDALILQLRALQLDLPEHVEEMTSLSGKKNHLSSLVKLTTGFSTMLRPSYLGAVMNLQISDKLKHRKKKKVPTATLC